MKASFLSVALLILTRALACWLDATRHEFVKQHLLVDGGYDNMLAPPLLKSIRDGSYNPAALVFLRDHLALCLKQGLPEPHIY